MAVNATRTPITALIPLVVRSGLSAMAMLLINGPKPFVRVVACVLPERLTCSHLAANLLSRPLAFVNIAVLHQ